MAPAVGEFWTTLIRLGLLDPGTAKDFARQVAAQGETSSDPTLAIAKFLIAQGVLTKFQAKRLLAQRGGELRQGEYLVLDRCEQPPLSRWLRARHLPTGTLALVYPCAAARDAKQPVDLGWLRPHLAVAAAGLQPLDSIQLAGASGDDASWRGLVVSALPAGRTLTAWLSDNGPLDASAAIAIGQVLGGALAAMHAASLVHGGLRPGRVWIGNDATVYLLRSGGGPPIDPEALPAPAYDWFDDDGRAPDFASPQWLSGQAQASVQDDVYSLGAVLYTAISGKPVTAGRFPAEVAAAVAAGAAGDPLLRVLAAALAPDAANRFADVPGLLRALDTAATLLAQPTAPEPLAPEPPAPMTSAPRAPAASVPASANPAAVVSQPVATAASVPTSKPQPVVTSGQGVQKAVVDGDRNAAAIEPAARRRRRTRRSRRGPVIVGSAAVAVLLLLVAVLMRSMQGSDQPTTRPPIPVPGPQPGAMAQGTPQTATGTRGADSAASPTGPATEGGFELVPDDRLLWVSPWPADSPSPPLDLVTPGAQVIVALRPGELLSGDSAADWRGWFGPELDPLLQSLQQRCGVPPEQMQRLVVSLLPGRDGEPVASLAVWLAEPVELEALLQRWNAEASRTPDGQTLYTGDAPDTDAYFIATGDDGAAAVSAFAVGPVEHMRLVAEGGGGPIPLPRALETAWSQSSDQADVVALISPNFLFADGRRLLQQYAPGAIAPLRDLLIPHVTAALVTLDTSATWYGEIRLVPGGTSSPAALMRTLQEQTAQLPVLGETFVVQHPVPASWRALAIRLPQYLRAIAEQTRFGISQSLPTANFYLPAEAAPQVALASLLALASDGTGASASALPGAASRSPATALSIDQLLDTPLSISFDQESLETAISMIGEEFARAVPEGAARPQLTIIGGDLEKSGITQNQQVRDFRMRDVPLRDVLTQLVLGANPDKTATGPADPKQSLIWVVDPAAPAEAPGLLITTRPQAEAKGYPLPREFTAS